MQQKKASLFTIKTILVVILILPCSSVFAQIVTQHLFNFKGFSLVLKDEASDENDNHMFVGEIRAIETEAVNRDVKINKLFDLLGYCSDERMGIIITTDKNYKIEKIAKSFLGEKVLYDKSKKQFTIGANFFDYIKVKDKNFSAWQPVIIQLDLKLNGNQYFVQKPYSCILDNFVIENNEIILFTRSSIRQEDAFKTNGKADVIRVTTSKFHTDTERPWIKVLEPISSNETAANIGRIQLSNVSKVDNAYYFTTSNLDQSSLKQVNHLYQFKNDTLKEILDFPEYLEFYTNYSDWININEFTTDSAKNYLFLSHEGATKKEMLFSKADADFNTLLSKKIPLNDYADFNKMQLLSNGTIVILMANNNQTWSYFLYDSNLTLIKEINSTISKEYNQNYLKETANNQIECFFNIDNLSKKDCIFQIINLN
jgi:hypothetical protein